jgi:TetR/AcrR family transcriptional repressor of multidrug resistance operon
MNVHSFGVFMGKRQTILTTAETLLAERGLYGFSMKLLADTAGIAAGTIYRYFENKEALINEVYQHITQETAQTFFKGWSDEQTPEHKYKQLWNNAFYSVLKNPQRSIVIEMLFSQPSLAKEQAAFFDSEMFFPLSNFYQQGIDEGRFHNWKIPALMTLSFNSAITLAKKVISNCLDADQTQINQVRDASLLIIQKDFNKNN